MKLPCDCLACKVRWEWLAYPNGWAMNDAIREELQAALAAHARKRGYVPPPMPRFENA